MPGHGRPASESLQAGRCPVDVTGVRLATSESRHRFGAPSPGDAFSGGLSQPELLSQVTELLGEGVAVFDLSEHLVFANAALGDIHACAPAELVGKHLRTFVTATDDDLRRLDRHAAKAPVRIEVESRRLDGSSIHVRLTLSILYDTSGRRTGRVVCVQDISERRRLEMQLERAAFHDSLTDLPNRRLLTDRLDHALAVAQRGQRKTAVLFLDLDGFKKVNDRHGHEVGDRVLVEVAERLLASLRTSDTLGRLGGDEFVVMLENVTGLERPQEVADRLLAVVSEPFEIDDLTICLTVSIGVAIDMHASSRSLLRDADGAMYDAKEAGGDQISFVLRSS